MSIIVYLENLALELVAHNVLYDRGCPIISDYEYDMLNKEYFRKCKNVGQPTDPSLTPDSGMIIDEGHNMSLLWPLEAEEITKIAKRLSRMRDRFTKAGF